MSLSIMRHWNYKEIFGLPSKNQQDPFNFLKIRILQSQTKKGCLAETPFSYNI